SSLSVRYRTALRPEKLDAKALRCRDAQERLPHPTQPLHQKTVGARPHPSFLTSTRCLGTSASTYTCQRLGLPNLAPLAPVGQCLIACTRRWVWKAQTRSEEHTSELQSRG